MSVLVALLTVVVVLLAVVVVGLLRTHAEVLRALERLGVGLEERPVAGDAAAAPAPAARTGRDAATVSGTTLDGGAQVVRVSGTAHDTLLLFLSSGCLTCRSFWDALRQPGGLGLPDRVRVVVVAKDSDQESPSELAELAPRRQAILLQSSQAWSDYEVPGSPYAVLVGGKAGRVIGEGTAPTWEQVGNLLAQATGDLAYAGEDSPRAPKAGTDAAIERDTDAELLAAGIRPGDPSLYPPAAGDGRDREEAPPDLEPPR